MSNVYDFDQARADYDKTAALSTTQDITPEDAARAFELNKVSGVPAGTIATNKDRFENDFSQRLSGTIIQNNPYLSDFINSHELHGPLVKDDLSNLDRLSDSYQRLTVQDAAVDAAKRMVRGVTGPRTPAGQIYGQGLSLQTSKAIVGIAGRFPLMVRNAVVDLINKAASGQLHQEITQGEFSRDTLDNASIVASLATTGGVPRVVGPSGYGGGG
jgi:hypothetical protein